MGSALRLLLDTHTFYWALNDPSALGHAARSAIESEQNEVMVSAVTAFEMSTKHRIGKWPQVEPIIQQIDSVLAGKRFSPLSITTAHAIRAGQLDLSHRDPFDRLLMAQALTDGLTLVSNEAIFDRFDVTRLW